MAGLHLEHGRRRPGVWSSSLGLEILLVIVLSLRVDHRSSADEDVETAGKRKRHLEYFCC